MATGMLLLPDPLSGQSQGTKCVPVHTFSFISFCVKDHEFSPVLIQHCSFYSNFLPFCIFFFFFVFLGPRAWHMEVPRLGV